jgi:hypothetical protein
MNIKVTIADMGGGYRKAVIGSTISQFDGRQYPDAIYGATDEELIDRLKTRLPGLRTNLLRRAKNR